MESEALSRLSALSHPQRLAIFRLLMRRYPDALRAGEIVEILGVKPSTASVYLATLSDAGLISQQRRGTSLLYRASLDGARGLVGFLMNDCCRGRPDLCPPWSSPDQNADLPVSAQKYSVLFICTGNSARSVFAEALLRDLAGDRFVAFSAGIMPRSELNPLAIEMLRSKGHDVSALRSKNITEFQGPDAPKPDFVFTVCDQAANEVCPPWPGQPLSAHWGLPDPVRATGTLAERRLAFQQTYGALRNRIKAFTALPFETLDRISLQAAVDNIGATSDDGEPA